MNREIKNCGLIALSEIIEIKTTSFKTLISAAKDNGVKLFPYIVDANDLLDIELPAIFHAENHFVYIRNKNEFKDYKLTGNILSTKQQPYWLIPYNKTKNIVGQFSWIAVGVGAATAIAGGIQANKAKKDKKRAAQEAANMKDVPLENVANELKVSTIGAKNRQEGQSALEATQIDALQQAGTRGVIGGAGIVAAGSQAINKDISADLDLQQKEIDAIKSQDAARIRSVKEERQKAKLAALSSQYNAANDAEQQGYGNIIQGAGSAGSAAAAKWGKKKSTNGSSGTPTPSPWGGN
ncbi:MAG: hypothetical protein V4666_08345 [Bacteroidota bacterium]